MSVLSVLIKDLVEKTTLEDGTYLVAGLTDANKITFLNLVNAIKKKLGAAAQKSVANNLTTAAAGTSVLDAYQGKLLSDKIDSLNSTMMVTAGSFRNLSSKISNYSKAAKMGNLVVLHLNFELKNAIVNGDCLIAVPSNMIPSDAVELSFSNASMRLNAGSGNITIRHNMPSGSWITGECVYLL